MAKIQRVKKRSKYLWISSNSVRWRTESLTLLCAPSGDEFAHVGITASRKVGCAVLRNRAKRRLRHASGMHGVESRLPSGYFFSFIANYKTPSISYAKLQSDMAYAVSKCIDKLKHQTN